MQPTVGGRRLLVLATLVAGGAALLILLAPEAQATHFRGGTMFATSDDADGDPLTARIHAVIYFRCSYWATNVCVSGAPNAPVPAPTPICFGDDSPCRCDWLARPFRVDTFGDWIGYEAWDPTGLEDGLLHTYEDEGPWTYYLGAPDDCGNNIGISCCRLSYGPTMYATSLCKLCSYFHYNNPDTPWRLEGRVSLPADQPYKDDLEPIQPCPRDTLCDIPLPATYAPAGGTYAVRLATAAESVHNGPWYQPGPCPTAGGRCCSPATTAWTTNGPPTWHWFPGDACCPDDLLHQSSTGLVPAVLAFGYYSTSVQLLGNDEDRSPLEWLVWCNPVPAPPDDVVDDHDPDDDPPKPPRPGMRSWQGSGTGPDGTGKGPMRCGPNPVHFTDSSEAMPPATLVAWHWQFGDGGSSTEREPSHQYPAEGGQYRVTLTVTDSNGQTASRSRLLWVAPDVECPTEQHPPERAAPAQAPRDGRDEAHAGADTDGDGIPDGDDLCPAVSRPGLPQPDLDGDGRGDPCDDDADGDGVADASDLCTGVADPSQRDLDRDAVGDLCDGDRDGDGVANDDDTCPDAFDRAQADADGDGIGDACVMDGLAAPLPRAGTALPLRAEEGAAVGARSPGTVTSLWAAAAVLAAGGAAVLVAWARARRP
jgi:hypothetical protein